MAQRRGITEQFLMWRDVLKPKHLLLIDLHSSGVSFYLAKDVSELPGLDFSSLVLLEQIFDEDLCKFNALADASRWQSLLQRKLATWQLQQYALVFLLTHQVTELEKQLLTAQLPFWQPASYVSRDYFYNFYLLQKRNFGPVKLIISCFADCAQLSLFKQETLLSHETIALFALTDRTKHFLQHQLALQQLSKPDCVYLFSHNQATVVSLQKLKKALELEVIEIKHLPE